MKKYYEILRELREDKEPKTNQKEIANLIGTSQQYYSEYENGKRPLPLEHLVTLCKYYNVSADYKLIRREVTYVFSMHKNCPAQKYTFSGRALLIYLRPSSVAAFLTADKNQQ